MGKIKNEKQNCRFPKTVKKINLGKILKRATILSFVITQIKSSKNVSMLIKFHQKLINDGRSGELDFHRWWPCGTQV